MPKLRNFFIDHAVAVGIALRVVIAVCLPILLDDNKIGLPAYTDIDYYVFTDAASHILDGHSPYDRTTYRYTPFLAALLAQLPHHRVTSRILFCLADALCGWLIWTLRNERTQPKNDDSQKSKEEKSLAPAAWWLYNPFVINICTRGSAESLVVLLPVLCTVVLCQSSDRRRPSYRRAFVAGCMHGLAMHAKLYPIIYTVSFMTTFCHIDNKISSLDPSVSSLSKLGRVLWLWTRRFLHPAPIIFAVTSILTFAGLTYLAVVRYGRISLEEGLLYHVSRVDHRHNYSMHWYWIYLGRARHDAWSALLIHMAGKLLLIPQLILLAFTSLGLAPLNLSLALFVQTFLFVAQNKVITAQYFTWYLCLLPLASSGGSSEETGVLQIRFSDRRVLKALIVLVVSILSWLGTAFCLELQGMAVHIYVWMASVLFFAANVNLLGALLRSTNTKTVLEGFSAKTKYD